MDLGATICTPRRPACGICPWMRLCNARAEGVQAELPRKLPKAAKPLRTGTVWVAWCCDAVLLETRPARGLLGGMPGFPGSDWDGGGGPAPLATDWHAAGAVRHTFTHFHLDLTVQAARVPPGTAPLRGAFVARAAFSPAHLPTLMRKAHDLAAATLGPIERAGDAGVASRNREEQR